jgi:hypothetical protein
MTVSGIRQPGADGARASAADEAEAAFRLKLGCAKMKRRPYEYIPKYERYARKHNRFQRDNCDRHMVPEQPNCRKAFRPWHSHLKQTAHLFHGGKRE